MPTPPPHVPPHYEWAYAALTRELAAMQREVSSYPDSASLYRAVAGLPNTGGVLVQHCAGNLRHFVGAVLGGTGYIRQRDLEFTSQGLSPDALVDELQRTQTDVAHGFAALHAVDPDAPWPGALPAGASYTVRGFLQHLTSHVAYHLGQLDYHRRLVTGNVAGVGAMDVTAMSPLP
ncbi:MAG: DUF664 domain-containing protein [Gemmatimonadaceae bacterium]|nr:DUF664 domain-containing protein [Gemmatimonadaceae bacterium]